ncbi:serine hydrolase [Rhodoferax sp. UBA5149]|uniref:serine hydrolase n=1 Tax=Rhodoferax sp. UBA5149 TaxID=1947379 RepID=UPI0025FDBA54|nr:serine hydrolase domain-containing protein [Rhodoferax sp. UBA5149]
MQHFKIGFAGLLSTLLLAAAIQANAADLPRAKPEQVGMSSQQLQLLTNKLKADVASKKLPGAVLLIGRHGKVAYAQSVGKLDPALDTQMTEDGLFRIYSMRKPITSVAAKMVVGVEKPDGNAGGA